MITAQIAVVNEYYTPDFQFQINSTDRIKDTNWFVTAPESFKELEMKTALRKGHASTLK
jgi:hypothetical protein